MPPKRPAKTAAGQAGQAKGKTRDQTETRHVKQQQPAPEQSSNTANRKKDEPSRTKETRDKDSSESQSKKRKKAHEPDQPQKTPRRSARGAPKSEPSAQQLLRYLLSQDAEHLCRPDDETADIESRGDIRTYSSSVLSPFEELLCAVILSRPISHRLGMRSIRTVLNDPYNFTTPKAIQAAGADKRHQALWDAKTQHKGKTAEQIGQIADLVLEKFTAPGDKDGTKLQKALEMGDHDIDKTLDILKDNIKGLGKTGLDIFLRRVQWTWDIGYPYVDDRTAKSLEKLGLPHDAAGVQKLIDGHWSDVDAEALAGDNAEVKKRRAFVLLLERAIGADLEGKVDALLHAAAANST